MVSFSIKIKHVEKITIAVVLIETLTVRDGYQN